MQLYVGQNSPVGPSLPASDAMHAEKYREGQETFLDARKRVCRHLTDDTEHYKKYLELTSDMRFMEAGRVQSASGSRKNVTAYNCFVSGTIEDSFVDGEGNIMQRAAEAAQTMRLGGGIGYDFSTLRPRGDEIKKVKSITSGPLAFMDIFNSICKCISSAGHRRGAQMGSMRIDHPDIEEFIAAKSDQSTLTGFNVSVGVTDAFMDCLSVGKPFPLTFNGKTYKHVDPRELWEKLMLQTWDWAEPGVLFLDTINRMNNLWYCEKISTTNPCGEQCLPPFGACLLGSFNLPKYLTVSGAFDYDLLALDIPSVVRAMDNVIDRTTYPLPQQETEAKAKRRMGLGVTGLANAIECGMGFSYGSPKFVETQDKIMSFITRHVYLASTKLARMKGSFELFDSKNYLRSKFIQTLDQDVIGQIKSYGIRNSHLTSIAPTGTISFCADNVSSGIEPVFALEYDRKVRGRDGTYITTMRDYGLDKFGVRGRVSSDVTVDEHLNVLLTAQRNVDSAVSKTCNVGDSVTFDEFKQVYSRAWEGGAKGCTTFRLKGKRFGILEAKPEEKKEETSCKYDPVTGTRSCDQ